MLAIRIKVNDKYHVTAGQNDWAMISMHVTASRDKGGVDDYVRLSTGGISKATRQGYCEHFRWPAANLAPGDKVELEIVDVEQIDAPLKRYRSDNDVQESPYSEEEWKELRYKDYLLLKEEFEGDASA
ncbi:MAG: hypothetical protein GC149_20225 [Gammaproteobacteria bacterium]|nr:hypothetical protein [Gammaproteobacteria bacterium]